MVKWMQFRTFELDSADDMQALPSHVKWVREGLLIIGLDTEMQVYSQWSTNPKASLTDTAEDAASVNKSRGESEEKDSHKSNKSNLIVRKNHSVLDLNKLHKMTKDPTHAKKIVNLGDDLESANKDKESLNEVSSWNSRSRVDTMNDNSANKARKFDQSEMLEIIQDSGLFMQAK
jgi:hypothetical protein